VKLPKRLIALAILAFAVLTPRWHTFGQAPFDDGRVMLQGFYWESHRHGHPERFPALGTKPWYVMVGENADVIRQGRFDLIWLPPPCYAGQGSAGYNPKRYFRLDNSYGSFAQHRAMLEALLNAGVEPVADVVINHRDGDTWWADFKEPDWGPWAICAEDEAFSRKDSRVADIPLSERGGPEEKPIPYGVPGTRDYAYDSFRDIDHGNPRVRRDVLRYLLLLKSAGYRGWRYDMVHGFHARWVALYNKRTQPTFSVGEYAWDRHAESRGWLEATATTPGDLRTSSAVFDFATLFALKNNKGKFSEWDGFGKGLGLVGDTSDGRPWKQRAVTFLENHDTGYRTKEDGTPEDGHASDSFQNGCEVEQAYAYLLTHPGVPCVYWKHYLDWGDDLRSKIRALINARKSAGVTSGSDVVPQENALKKGIYGAKITGTKGTLHVRIGDDQWQPTFARTESAREYARGERWTVWVELPGNPGVQQAPLKAAFAIPKFRRAEEIDVPTESVAP
jgi:alpha-amylase